MSITGAAVPAPGAVFVQQAQLGSGKAQCPGLRDAGDTWLLWSPTSPAPKKIPGRVNIKDGDVHSPVLQQRPPRRLGWASSKAVTLNSH